MPTVDLFDPVPGLNRWFSCQGRQARSNPKAKQQAWFQGVFFEASDASQDRGADECGNDLTDFCESIDDDVKTGDDNDEAGDCEKREVHF